MVNSKFALSGKFFANHEQTGTLSLFFMGADPEHRPEWSKSYGSRNKSYGCDCERDNPQSGSHLDKYPDNEKDSADDDPYCPVNTAYIFFHDLPPFSRPPLFHYFRKGLYEH